MLQCCIFLLWGLIQMVQLDGLCPELVALGGCCMYGARPLVCCCFPQEQRDMLGAYLVCQFRLVF